MELFDTLKKRTYGSITVIASLFMFVFLPFVQSLGNNIDLWYSIILNENYGLNFALFVAFCALFGSYVSFQIYKFKQPKTCKINAAGGAAGSAFALFVGVCPACIGFAGLFLPLGIVTTLVVFGPIFMLISIALILFSIQRNGGFK